MSEQTKTQLELSQQEKLATFENRWRFAVFPAMVAFIVLSAFGFYLIYGMLERMKALSEDIDRMTHVMSETLPIMQGAVVSMSAKMQSVGDDLDEMATDVHNLTGVIGNTLPSMENHLISMASNINQMSYSTAAMAATTDNMGRNIWDMNRNISKPMSFFGDMMPWQSSNISTQPPSYSYFPYQYQYPIYPVQRQITVPTVEVSKKKSKTRVAGENKYNGYCASCHGLNAEGGVGPDLRNFSLAAISESLNDYKDGTAKGTMSGVVKTLSNRDIANIARFISEKPTIKNN